MARPPKFDSLDWKLATDKLEPVLESRIEESHHKNHGRSSKLEQGLGKGPEEEWSAASNVGNFSLRVIKMSRQTLRLRR